MRAHLRQRPLRLVGWIVAYVLALQTMLLGFTSVPSVMAAATGSPLIELCLSGSLEDGADSQQQHPSSRHCLACFTTTATLPPVLPDGVRAPDYPSVQPVLRPTPILRAALEGGRPNLPRAPPALA